MDGVVVYESNQLDLQMPEPFNAYVAARNSIFLSHYIRRRGLASIAMRAALARIKKKGGGLVEAYPATRKGALSIWFGTVSTFGREGFKTVAPFGRSNVIMRRTI